MENHKSLIVGIILFVLGILIVVTMPFISIIGYFCSTISGVFFGKYFLRTKFN